MTRADITCTCGSVKGRMKKLVQAAVSSTAVELHRGESEIRPHPLRHWLKQSARLLAQTRSDLACLDQEDTVALNPMEELPTLLAP